MNQFPFINHSTALSLTRFFPSLDVANFNLLYSASLCSVVDGDTFRCNINSFPGIILSDQRVRINRINAPEIKSSSSLDNLLLRSFLSKCLTGSLFYLQPCRRVRDKYQRLLCEVFVRVSQCPDSSLVDQSLPFFNLSDLLLSSGMAQNYV